MQKTQRRDGTTLVEVLVVLGITSLLVGVLLPAIQAAREAARANDCKHRMRQLAMAAHAFHDTYGALPATFHTRLGRPAFPRMLSPWAQLLPYLDQTALYQQIDQDSSEIGLGVYANPPSLTRPINQQLLKTGIPVVRCPSDAALAGACNFRVCVSSGPTKHVKSGQGAWVKSGSDFGVSFGEITDGLSQTAFVSERVVGDSNDRDFTPSRDIYFFNWSGPSLYSPDEYAQACRSQFRSPLPGEVSYSGATWLISGLAFTHYNHTLPPNSEVPDCSHVKPALYSAATTARSWHRQGVNVAFADGHVSRIAETVDLKVWRAIATRNGAEGAQIPN